MIIDSYKFEASGPPDDSIGNLSPLAYYTPASIDPSATSDTDAVTVWNDVSGNGLHATPNNNAELNIGTGSVRQVQFDGTDWFDIANDDLLKLIPGTDEFTIIAREGDVGCTNGYAISKASTTTANREFGMYYSTTTTIGAYAGGNTNSATVTANNNRLTILVVGTSTWAMYVDGVTRLSGETTGTGNDATQSVNIGARSDGSYLIQNGGQLDILAIIPSAISAGERAAIEAEFQVN